MNKIELKYTSTSFPYIEQELRKLDLNQKSYRLTITDWAEKRTLSANGQMHIFFKHIGEFQSVPMPTAKQRSKIDFGLPIILAREDDYSKVVDYILTNANFYKMSREKQEVFITAIAITSKFTTSESKTFMDQLIFYWNDKGLMIGYKD